MDNSSWVMEVSKIRLKWNCLRQNSLCMPLNPSTPLIFWEQPRGWFWQPHLPSPGKYKQPQAHPADLHVHSPHRGGNVLTRSVGPINSGLHFCFMKVTFKHRSQKHLRFYIYPENMAFSFKGESKIPGIWNEFKGQVCLQWGEVMQSWCIIFKEMRLCQGHIHVLTRIGHSNHTWKKTLI